MAYGTVKVNFITYDVGGGDQTIPVVDLTTALTSGITVTGTISGQALQAVSGTITSLSGTTATYASFVGDLTGNASTADYLSSNKNFTVTGDVTGTTSGDLSSDIVITVDILSGVITDADINASAGIAGTKIDPDFGSQNITTTALVAAGVVSASQISATSITGVNSVTAGYFEPTSTGNPTNGMYLPAANTLGFSTNGSKKATLDENGYLALSPTIISGVSLLINRNLTGASTGAGVMAICYPQSDVGFKAYGYYSKVSATPSGSLGNPDLYQFYADGDTGTSLTTPSIQCGFYAANTLSRASVNYGFYSAVASGEGYGFYESAGNPNYFEGPLTVADNIQVNSINNGPLAGFRNAIINGNFDVWQRGTTQTVAGYGSADRWLFSAVGSTFSTSRQAFTLGQTSVPGEPRYYYRSVVTSVAGAANYAFTSQRIESVRTFAGQQVTASFWAKANANRSLSFELVQRMGTGGSPSADVLQIGVTKVNLTTSWQKFTVTTTVPSLSGKTLGTAGNDSLILRIWFDAGSDFNANTNSLGQQSGTFDIARVQLEAGPIATPYESRPLGTELLLCQRYFRGPMNNQVLGAGSNALRYAGGSNIMYCGHITFGQPMRAAPSVTLDTSSITYVNCSNLQTGIVYVDGTFFSVTTTGAGIYYANSWTATFDAEL